MNRLRGMIMLLMGIYVVRLAVFHQLQYYIHPRYIPITIAAAVVTLAVSVALWLPAIRRSNAGYSPPVSRLLKWMGTMLLVAIILPAKPLVSPVSPASLQPGAPLGPNAALLLQSPVDPQSPNLTIREWIILLNRQQADIKTYDGHTIDVAGFLYPNGDRQFYVSRLVVTCCTADASLVGIPVQYDWSKHQFQKNDWVRVVGKLSIVDQAARPTALIVPDNVIKITQPDVPYIY